VGGRTIEEAKERLSFPEVQDWRAFRRKHGPLWSTRRIEWALAQVAYTVAATAGAKGKDGQALTPESFMPKYGEPEADREATLDDLARIFGVKK
jgi:uncharacterized protein YbjT (DUF2867 family)